MTLKTGTLKIGDRIPSIELTTPGADGPQKINTSDFFKGRKIVLFGVPGAFTPTCSMNHLPGFVADADAIKAKGIDEIACASVNDIHVMKAWGKHSGSEGKITMLADGNAEFARACGLAFDLAVAGMGERSRRYSMIVDNGVVTQLNVEDKGGVNVSGADTILTQL
jgi:glutaredoxin/glutathione-dependent peroxiredoxin